MTPRRPQRPEQAGDSLDRADGRGERPEDLHNRDVEGRYDTPRQYDEDDAEDPVMPSDDSSLNTKI